MKCMGDSTEVKYLKSQIKDLEQELQDREHDLAAFRTEVVSANGRLEKMISELNTQLAAVHKLQKILVPTEIGQIQGFEFSTKFLPSYQRGGDYYDVFEHEDRSQFGILAASCTGHVMSALLISVLLKLTSQMEARRGLAADALMAKILSELLPSIGPNDSADVFYAIYDRRRSSIRYCLAGALTCLHYDHGVGSVKLLGPHSDALKSGGATKLDSTEVNLGAQDKIIVCSRGAIEAKNLAGQEFGQDRLFQVISQNAAKPVHELRNKLIFDIQQFSQGCELPRDLTVIVAEVKDRLIKLARKNDSV
jgi:sigma-B regulation protein RsbU (phosphoserine phosphatase)